MAGKIFRKIRSWFVNRIVRLLAFRNPELATRILFRHRMGYRLDLENPKTYSEKLLWLKLRAPDPLMARCGDKYGVRGFARERGCPELLNELYGVYDNPDEIDFSIFPERFVLKITNASGYNLVCDRNTLDEKKVRRQLRQWLGRPFGIATVELHYLQMPARIICEKYLVDRKTGTLNDYKVHCLNGVPVYYGCYEERVRHRHKIYRFDFSGNVINPVADPALEDTIRSRIPDPAILDTLYHYSRILSAGIKMVRVDFYLVDSRPILGEMTFVPSAGCNHALDTIFRDDRYRHHLEGIC